MPSGSYLIITHATNDHMPPETLAAVDGADEQIPFQFRSRDEFGRFLDGMDLAPPGIVSVAEWRAETEAGSRPSAAETAVYGAVAEFLDAAFWSPPTESYARSQNEHVRYEHVRVWLHA